MVQIEIFHRFSWRRSTPWTNHATCSPGDNSLLDDQGDLVCVTGCSGVVSATTFYCTDQNLIEDWVTGTRTYLYTLHTTDISTGFEARQLYRHFVYLFAFGLFIIFSGSLLECFCKIIFCMKEIELAVQIVMTVHLINQLKLTLYGFILQVQISFTVQ